MTSTTPQAQFAALVSRFPGEAIARVKRCLPRIRTAVPCTHEVVYDYGRQIVVSLSMSERGYEAIVSIAILPTELRLYFSKDLPDPNGLLEGAGGKVRFVTIKNAADLDRAEIKALLKAAVTHHKHSGTKPPASAAGRNRSTIMIIKSGSSSKGKAGSTTKPSKKKRSKKSTSKQSRTGTGRAGRSRRARG